MKILFYQDLPSINSTLLTWTLCEELRLLGHTVHYGKQPLLQEYDWVHGYGKDSWEALRIAKRLKAKCHIHLEGVAYWRIGVENATDWGYERNHTQEEIDNFRGYYISWMSAAYEANSCSVNGANQVKTIENSLFNGKPLPNCHRLSCGVDSRYSDTLRPYYIKKWQMVTASRLEENKKVFMIAEALAKLDTEKLPIWTIIGYGSKSQTERLISFCNEHKIKMRLKPCFGAEKWKIINDSCLMLQGWSGIPPSEGLMCKTPVISFNHEDIVEMYDDSIYWAKDNDTEDMASKIEELLKNVTNSNNSWLDTVTEDGKQKLLNGRLYACTQNQAAKKYIEIFEGKQ